MVIFEIINATDSLKQNVIIIICLCWLVFDFLTSKTLETMLNYALQFVKIRLVFNKKKKRLVFHTPYPWNEAGDPQFLFHFWNKLNIIRPQ